MTAVEPSAGGGRYGRVARAIHWLIGALAVMVVALGWASGSAPHNSPARDGLLLLHRSVGLAILGLMVVARFVALAAPAAVPAVGPRAG